MKKSNILTTTILIIVVLTLFTACSQPEVDPTAVIIAPDHIEAGHIITVDAVNSTAAPPSVTIVDNKSLSDSASLEIVIHKATHKHNRNQRVC